MICDVPYSWHKLHLVLFAGLDAVMTLLAPETEAQLLESAVDLVCKLASGLSGRKPLVDAVRSLLYLALRTI